MKPTFTNTVAASATEAKPNPDPGSRVGPILSPNVVVEANILHTPTSIVLVQLGVCTSHEGGERPLKAAVLLTESETLCPCFDHTLEVSRA